MELNGDYSVWQVLCSHLHITSQSQDFQHWSCSPYKFQKTWSASFHSHINLRWLGNLRFDYSNWLHKTILPLSHLFQISWAFALSYKSIFKTTFSFFFNITLKTYPSCQYIEWNYYYILKRNLTIMWYWK